MIEILQIMCYNKSKVVWCMAWCNCCEKEAGVLYYKTVASKSGNKAEVFVCDICFRKLDNNEELIDMVIFKFKDKISADIEELLRKLNMLKD